LKKRFSGNKRRYSRRIEALVKNRATECIGTLTKKGYLLMLDVCEPQGEEAVKMGSTNRICSSCAFDRFQISFPNPCHISCSYQYPIVYGREQNLRTHTKLVWIMEKTFCHELEVKIHR
jgi:hypothetical protein